MDWPNSTMLNDKWNGALPDNEGTNTFSMRWILPTHAEAMALHNFPQSPNLREIKIESREGRDLLNSDRVRFRAGSSFVPRGELPVLKLEEVNDAKSRGRMRELMERHLLKELLGGDVRELGGLFVSKSDSASFRWSVLPEHIRSRGRSRGPWSCREVILMQTRQFSWRLNMSERNGS